MENIKKRNRVWEIDFLRGVALILMIIFHVVFDLRDLYNYPVEYSRGIFYYVGKASAILFMLVAGISSSFTRSNAKRGLRILALAMFITLATYVFNPSLIIVFGILHFFGVSMILYTLFKDMNKYLIVIIGTIIIILGNIMSGITMNYDYFFPIGLISGNFMSSDYYPLFPWFGVFLYGVAIGKALYKEKKSLLNFCMGDNFIMLMGRHSLIVYVIHQPITLLILYFLMK